MVLLDACDIIMFVLRGQVAAQQPPFLRFLSRLKLWATHAGVVRGGPEAGCATERVTSYTCTEGVLKVLLGVLN